VTARHRKDRPGTAPAARAGRPHRNMQRGRAQLRAARYRRPAESARERALPRRRAMK